jgi:hypothetical protein
MGGDTSDTYGSSKTDDYSSGNTGVSLPLLLLLRLRFEKPCHTITNTVQSGGYGDDDTSGKGGKLSSYVFRL